MESGARIVMAALLSVGLIGSATSAEYMEKNDFQKKFAFSPAVITQGGRIIWLAGATALRDDEDKDIAGQFEPQARAIFRQMDAQLKAAGGSLSNLVTMTVYVTDPANVPRFVELRKALFKDGNYPASTLIASSGFALPGIVIEIQGTAVISDFCSASASCSRQ